MMPKASRTLLLVLVILFCCPYPATALLNLRTSGVIPPGEFLPPGTVVNASAGIEIIPSGATTFAGTHTLALSTGLEEARWSVTVMVDGLRAAVIPKDGNRVFVNGFLLSYPTSRDVAVVVLVEGRVPAPADGRSFAVFTVEELNGRGLVVGGSEQTVTRTISFSAPSTSSGPPADVRTTYPPEPTTAGISFFMAFAGLFTVFLLMRRGAS